MFILSLIRTNTLFRCLTVFLGTVMLSTAVQAVNVDGLYTGITEVDSRSSESDRQAAFATTMRQVLLKVTGRAEVLDNTGIRRALASPQFFVESWAYGTRQNPETGSEVTTIQIKFFQPQIQQLLDQNGLRMWPQNRPLTLVWIIEQGSDGRRQVVREGSPMMEVINIEAEKRGLPLLFPLMDLDDLRTINSELLWNMDAGHIAAISRRYGAESVLVLRIFSSLGNEYLGRSLFSFRGQEFVQDLYGESLEEMLRSPVDEAAEHLAEYYAVYLSGSEALVPVLLQVDGINTLDQYAGLMKYVESLTDVSSVAVEKVDDDKVYLELQTGGQIRQLIESISLDRTLQPVSEATRAGSTVSMHYRWQR